jgi:DNA transformation protein
MKDQSFKAYILEQLESLGQVRSRAMFGGVGLYHKDIFFGLLDSGDTLYFKTDPDSLPMYLEHSMTPFEVDLKTNNADGKTPQYSYYTVPIEVIEDQEELVVWARRAVQAQLRAKAAAPKRSRTPKKTVTKSK